MSSRKEMIQCKDSIVILRSRATKNLYKSIRRQILDCTSFVFLFLARHSPQAVSGSQGKRFFTSFRMTKGLDSGRSRPGRTICCRRCSTLRAVRAAASQRGSSPLRLSPGSLLRRLRSLRLERAYVVSSQTLLHGQRRRCSRAEAGGASVASLRRAGLRLARLNAGFLRKPNTEQLIPTSQSALPSVTYSSLPRSLRTIQ